MLFVRGVEGLLPELAAPWTDFFMKSAYYFNTWARFNTICSSMFLWLLLSLFRPSQCQGMSPDFISVRLCLFVCPSVQGDECGHRGVGYLQLLLLSHYLSASIATWPFPLYCVLPLHLSAFSSPTPSHPSNFIFFLNCFIIFSTLPRSFCTLGTVAATCTYCWHDWCCGL